MQRHYFVLLFQFVFIGKLIGQNSFDQQHEKFIRLHREVTPDKLLAMIRTEEKLINEKKPKPFNLYKAKLELDRGIYFYMIDDYPKCIASFEQVVKLNSLTSNRDNILLNTYLGVSYRNGQEDFKRSHVYLDKAIEFAGKEADPDLLASAIIKKADTYDYKGQFLEGVRLLESFLKKGKKLTYERILSFHQRLARSYDNLGSYSKSYTHFTKAIEIAEKTKNTQLIIDSYHNFIIYFLNKERYKEAKVRTFHVIRLIKDKPEFEGKLYDLYIGLGQIYSSLNQPDSALYYTHLSHEYALKTGDKESLHLSYGTLGKVHYEKEEYDKALDFMLKSLEYAGQFVGAKDLAGTYHNIAASYLYLKNYSLAIDYFEKSNEQAYLEGDLYILHLNYGDLAKTYRKLGNLEQVIVMIDSSFQYYDSLTSIEESKELLNLEVRYETKLKEKQNKLLKLEVKRQNDLREKERKARWITIISGLVLVLILSGIVYILFIKNRLRKSKVAEADAKIQNQKLEEELLLQRLNLLTEEINRKNKLIQSMEKDTSSVMEESLINKITLENDWLAFMSEFDKIHSGYLAELKREFPTLTTNNLRLAALAKLEFSNKEIANILCITENGVKKAKQRLKERIKMD